MRTTVSAVLGSALLALPVVPALASPAGHTMDHHAGAPAGGPGTMPGQGGWMSVAEIAAHVESQGFTVRSVEADDGFYEVDVWSPNGLRQELLLDPVSGAIVRQRADD
ncbi:PepSY domain-containing protein [Roseospira marina]|uniref:PepSY domain-containing protein n=1 Tax=Roseospira marina TaxID=140057 RepID=A0A5M6I7P5_9PROT|nr:PepSY domain-containing protein [Roseospira marina]KAA5603917.1 PepSY domain-containing protein [Roseospira marina]MBB4315978.1 hypothetical protein [Roseospira marina]MBB5089152.1 hypothetical protein [Roseospira marina]